MNVTILILPEPFRWSDHDTGGPACMKTHGALWNSSHLDFFKMAAPGILSMIRFSQGSEQIMVNFIERRSYRDLSPASIAKVSMSAVLCDEALAKL